MSAATGFTLEKMMSIVISLIFMSILLPIGLVYMLNIGNVNVVFNGANTTLSAISGADTVVVLLGTLVPITIAIIVVAYYVKQAR